MRAGQPRSIEFADDGAWGVGGRLVPDDAASDAVSSNPATGGGHDPGDGLAEDGPAASGRRKSRRWLAVPATAGVVVAALAASGVWAQTHDSGLPADAVGGVKSLAAAPRETWSAPITAPIGVTPGGTGMIVQDGDDVVALAPADGHELWRLADFGAGAQCAPDTGAAPAGRATTGAATTGAATTGAAPAGRATTDAATTGRATNDKATTDAGATGRAAGGVTCASGTRRSRVAVIDAAGQVVLDRVLDDGLGLAYPAAGGALVRAKWAADGVEVRWQDPDGQVAWTRSLPIDTTGVTVFDLPAGTFAAGSTGNDLHLCRMAGATQECTTVGLAQYQVPCRIVDDAGAVIVDDGWQAGPSAFVSVWDGQQIGVGACNTYFQLTARGQQLSDETGWTGAAGLTRPDGLTPMLRDSPSGSGTMATDLVDAAGNVVRTLDGLLQEPFASDGRPAGVELVQRDGGLIAVDEQGNTLWTASTSGQYVARAAGLALIAPDGGDPTLQAVDLATGHTMWTWTNPDTTTANPNADNYGPNPWGWVAGAFTDGQRVSVELARNLAPVTPVEMDPQEFFAAVSPAPAPTATSSPSSPSPSLPTADDGTITYTYSMSGYQPMRVALVTLDLDTGHLVWSTQYPTGWQLAAVGGRLVAVDQQAGWVHGLG